MAPLRTTQMRESCVLRFMLTVKSGKWHRMEKRARGNGATLPKGDSLAKMDDPRRGWHGSSTQIRGDTLFHDQINFIHESENLTKKSFQE